MDADKKKKTYETEKRYEPKKVETKSIVITNCIYVNVRTAPSGTAPIVRTVPAGAKLEANGTFGSWTQLADGTYINSAFTKVVQ